MNDGYIYHDHIPKEFDGATVLEFYSRRYPSTSVEDWAARIAEGRIRCNETVLAADSVVRAGDHLLHVRPPWEEPAVPTDLKVVFEDEDVLVIDKPAGLPVMPGSQCLQNTAIWLARNRLGYPPSTSPAHRLDTGTSGLLLFGKNRETLSALGNALRRGEVHRRYLAVLEGIVGEDHFFVDEPIGPETHPAIGAVHVASASGKAARTEFRVLDRTPAGSGGGETLAELVLHTGRSHQARIHAAVAGHPLVGEPFYVRGGKWDAARAMEKKNLTLLSDSGYRLHAWRIEFDHPHSGDLIRLQSLPRSDFWPGLDLLCRSVSENPMERGFDCT